jgi:hypothetical protein
VTGTGNARPWLNARGVVGVEELVAEAEQQGIEHGMDLAAFRAEKAKVLGTAA